MKKNIKIDLYADISCPWCYIGSFFLNKAIKNKNSYKFKVYWRTFYLNPSIPFSGLDRNKYLENKTILAANSKIGKEMIEVLK